MKLALRTPWRMAAANSIAARPPILPGYRPWDAAGFMSRHKRKLLVALFVLTFFYSAFFLLVPRALSVPLSFPIVAIWLMIVWALPVREYAPTKILSGLLWAYYAALFLWPNYLAISIPGLPWITVARLFCAPMVAILLVYVSNCGPFRRAMKDYLASSRRIVRLIAAFAAVQFLATFFSPAPFDTVNRMINNQIIWTAVFFVAVWAFRVPGSIERWMRLYLLFAAILCVVAELEVRNQGVLWANSIPSFLVIEDESVQRLLAGVYRLGSLYRVVATATSPLSLAELLGGATPFLLFALVQYKNLFLRLALIAFDVVLVYCILLTDSRLGLVSMLVGHAAYLLYISYRIYRFSPNSLIRTIPVVVYPLLLTATLAAVLFVGRINNAVIGDGRQQFSDASRATQIEMGLVKIWESPVLGFGAAQGGPKLGFTNAGGVLTIDSYYLSILLDYGFVGFFVFYGLIITAIVQGAKIAIKGTAKENHIAAALSIFLLCFFTTKAVLSQESNHPVMFMALGALVALTYSIKQKPVTPDKISL
jgi:hypothetical protein